MKLEIGLSRESINKAIKALRNEEKRLNSQMIPDFLIECCKWFINRANKYLDKSQIGQNVVNGIKDSWSYSVLADKKTARVVNDNNKAVFVEFGVGLMGQSIPHPNAKSEGYIYDSHERTASGNPYWVFNVDSEEDVDMQQGYIFKNAKDGGLWIITKGSWGELYAYRTLMDFSLEKKVLKGLWTKIKLRYWG